MFKLNNFFSKLKDQSIKSKSNRQLSELELLSMSRQSQKKSTKSNQDLNDTLQSGIYENDWIEEENMVRIILKSDPIYDVPSKKKFGAPFDQQRLILKSLYEIRRNRINNRDVNDLFPYYFFLYFITTRGLIRNHW